MAAAQARLETFRAEVFGADADSIDPLWFRAFIANYPEAFLGDVEAARAAATHFGDPRAGRAPVRERFRDQTLQALRVPRWLWGVSVAGIATLAAAGALLSVLSENGLLVSELIWVVLFAFLFNLSAMGCVTAMLGFGVTLRNSWRARRKSPQLMAAADLPRTALVMPIYEEDPEHVFAGLLAMREALAATPGGEAFEIFVLSDSRKPEQVAEEERAFRRIASIPGQSVRVFYRRRAKNERAKAGNLAEFFERFGDRYTYAVILDADSLMRADTLVELVRRMEQAPRVALLQAPLFLHGGSTLFSRAQQFVASVNGPMFTSGLGYVSGPHGNYFGHNAIVRVRAFLDCCALPVLAGQPPLGGHILSHDFVEAALLCRAGWEVRIADDLSGSWEELPPSLPEYVARDRRWCQGNLQHLRIAVAEGLKPMSRLHMLVGAGSYLAGPAWLMFIALGVWLAHGVKRALVPSGMALVLTAATALLLLGPRVLGWLATLVDRQRRRGHAGALRLTAGVLVELALGSMLAPLLMLHHTRIVISILVGGAVKWGAQQRRHTRGKLGTITRSELPQTLVGVAAGAWLSHWAPELLWWTAPIWVPLALAIPLSLVVSSRRVGQLFNALGLLRVPSEVEPDEMQLRVEDLRALTTSDDAARFRDLVLDPLLVSIQLARIEKQPQPTAAGIDLVRVRQRALRMGPAALSVEERRALSLDAESLRFLHREAWRSWPVESWQLSRDVPQLPETRTNERPSLAVAE
ncbi:MAG TPA: glucans biosynthesis glucosyltransferase MdoH [Polyangiales bacterium]|nr:glucans biosynthesis glucosyltransferase MdoH [Polyangiales bacterium]